MDYWASLCYPSDSCEALVKFDKLVWSYLKCATGLTLPLTAEKGEGFDVLKSGDARVAMIGFPSVGKSTLLSSVTKTESAMASYEFTTLTCIPGVIDYKV